MVRFTIDLPFYRRALLAVVTSCLMAASPLSAADSSGLELQGTEELHSMVVLSASPAAPAGTTGLVVLEAEDQGGAITAHMDFQVQGLAAGAYTISIGKKSDTNAIVALGTFNVSLANESIRFSTDADPSNGHPLPVDFDPLDVGFIWIANADGQMVFTGDLLDGSSVMSGLFKAKVPVISGAAAPGASGMAFAKSKVTNGVRTTRFKLFARGAIPNATLTLKINGIDYGTVNTDDNGNLKLQNLPDGVDAESILWMEFDDPDGTNALSISF